MGENWWVVLPGLLAALVLHELAHGLVADALGDPTPRQSGRLTLNPLVHLDPVGALMFWFFHFGWARPVVVNPAYFADPLRGMMLVAAAGPVTNLVLAYAALAALRLSGADPAAPAGAILATAAVYNVWLGVFNLIPLPPLDGSKVLAGLLRGRIRLLERLEPYGWLVLVLLVSTGVVGRFLDPAVWGVLDFLDSLAGHLQGIAAGHR